LAEIEVVAIKEGIAGVEGPEDWSNASSVSELPAFNKNRSLQQEKGHYWPFSCER